MKTFGEVLPAGFRKGLNPGGEGLGFEEIEGDQLTATVGATYLARDGLARFG